MSCTRRRDSLQTAPKQARLVYLLMPCCGTECLPLNSYSEVRWKLQDSFALREQVLA